MLDVPMYNYLNSMKMIIESWCNESFPYLETICYKEQMLDANDKMIDVWYTTRGPYVADKRKIRAKIYVTSEDKPIVKNVCETHGIPIMRVKK